MDVEITIDALHFNKYDIAIFFTGTRTFATDYLFKNDKESVCFFLKIIFQPN